MKVTYILKDFSEVFYTGNGQSILGLLNMSDKDKFFYLDKKAKDKIGCTQKIGTSNSFRDRVELNQIIRKDNVAYTFKLDPRKGYKLATFEVA